MYGSKDVIYNSNTLVDVLIAPDFAAGKTYVYKYEALLLGGLPEEGLAKAGLKVSSKVLISAVTQKVYMLKVRITIMFKQQSFYF